MHPALIAVVGFVVIVAIILMLKKKDKKQKAPTQAELEAQAMYEADLAVLASLEAQLAQSPTGILQAQIAALKTKLGM
jgi:hypothetical protein